MPTVRKSLDDVEPISQQELKRIAAIGDENIDYSDIPPLGPEFWEQAEVRVPAGKKQITIRLDADVLSWLKAQGAGYQSRINAILRSYYEAHHDTENAPRR